VNALRLAALFLLLAGCAGFPYGNIEPPRAFLSDIRLVSVGVFEQRYSIDLRLQNPNDVELPVTGMDYRLRINGEEFASGVSNRSWRLPPYGEQLVTVELVSSTERVLEQFRRIEKRGSAVDYALSGGIALGRNGPKLPFESRGTLRLAD
jgi:LEA14-like dessication related protein